MGQGQRDVLTFRSRAPWRCGFAPCSGIHRTHVCVTRSMVAQAHLNGGNLLVGFSALTQFHFICCREPWYFSIPPGAHEVRACMQSFNRVKAIHRLRAL